MTAGRENSHDRRKRRTHQKSRRGCRNCKLRRVKCDEARPGCKKCSNFGVSCNYDDPNAPDLQTICHSVTWGSPVKGLPPKSASSSMESCFSVAKAEVLNSLRPGLPCLSDDGKSTILLDIESQGRLDRFITRTVLTVGTSHVSVIFQAEISSIICGYPYLMHMVQALTALHDRILSPYPDAQQTKAELYHASRAAALFNAKLSKPLQQEDRDPMWATAALLGIAAMCWIEASCAEDSWPLTVRNPSDLDWIRMSRSKAAIWDLTDPLRKGGRFRRMAEEQHQNYKSARMLLSKLGIGELPGKLLQLCGVDEHATVHSNRYLLALQMLGPAMAVETARANLLIFLSFISSITDDFQDLLRERDPRALLLMAFWYAKINGATWWLDRRSTLEGQAICMYLERYHAHEVEILELLSYPKTRLGMLT